MIGLHFLQPVPQVPLVEVVRGLGTSDATFRQAMDFVRLLGKTGIEVFEYPGYVTTRVILPFLNEAMHVVMEGVATAGGGRHLDEARLRAAGRARSPSPTGSASTR